MAKSLGARNKRFFVKVYIFFILIVALYTCIAAGMFFFRSVQALDKEWGHNVQRSVEQIREQMDFKIDVAFNLINQIKRSSEMVNYSNFTELNYYNITVVVDLLRRNSEAFGEYGYRIDVMKAYDDRLVATSNGTMSKGQYYRTMQFTPEQIGRIDQYADEGSYSEVLLLKNNLTVGSGRSYDPLTIVKKELSGRNDVLFVISFYESGFYPTMDKSEKQINAIGILSHDELIDVIGAGYDAESLLENKHAEPVQSSAIRQVKYLFVTEPYSWRPQLSGGMLDSAIIFGLLLIFGAGVAFLASRNIYKPVLNLLTIFRSLEPDKKLPDGSPQSTVDEMSYIAETAMTISNTNRSLKETIRNNRLSLKHNFLRDALYGIASPERIREQLSKHELEAFSGGLTVIVMELINARDLDDQFPMETVAEIKAGTFKVILENMRSKLSLEMVELEHKRYALVVTEQQINVLKKTISQILLGVESDIGMRVVAAIGRPVISLAYCESSYRDALRLLEQRVAVDRNTVLTINDSAPQSPDNYYYPLDRERELITCVIQGKLEQAKAVLDGIVDENMEERRISGEMMSRFIFALDATVHRILQQMNRTYGEMFGDSPALYEELKRCENSKMVKERLHEVIAALSIGMNSQNEELDNTIAKQILDHIHNHFNQDIALSDIAEQFNLSISYVSSLFKRHNKENFKDYLSQYRVSKAKELLSGDNNISINEVAAKVGYNNANTFIRVFKKYEGISPGQYKKTE